jgi:hypothetical protein
VRVDNWYINTILSIKQPTLNQIIKIYYRDMIFKNLN